MTFFNEYRKDYLDKIHILRKIAELPKDLADVYGSKETMIKHRLSGLFDGYQIYFISDLAELSNIENIVKVVFLSEKLIESDHQALFVSNSHIDAQHCSLCSLKEVNVKIISSYVDSLAADFNNDFTKYVSEIKELYEKDSSSEKIEFDGVLARCISTEANLIALTSSRLNFSYESSKYECEDEDVVETVNLINHIRNEIIKNTEIATSIEAPEIVFSDMSMSLDFQLNKSNFTANALRHEGFNNPEELEDIIKNSLRGIQEGLSKENLYAEELYNEKLLQEVLLGLYLCGHLTPHVKLPLSNRDIFSLLKDVGICDRRSKNSGLKKKFRQLVNQMDLKVTSWFEYLNDKRPSTVKLLSNLPIEWSTHNELPLMVRHDVSRIPVSPGWLTSHLLLESQKVLVDMDSFRNIPVISSFRDDDPIRNDLKEKLIEFREMQPSGEVSSILRNEGLKNDLIGDFEVSADIQEPSSFEELISFLNGSKSPIVIFDLHGGHSENGSGVIKLKSESVSVADLIGKARIPPIVILSSCDTNPIDRNHYSTANALLAGGAKTVLASALPILSKEASIFIFRLFVRLQHYLPIIINGENKSLKWSSFVSGMIRRTYYSELLSLVSKKNKLSDEKVKKLNISINLKLDPLSEDFHKDILETISRELSIEVATIKAMIDTEVGLLECLKYIQIGNPDQVIIVSPNHIKTQHHSEAYYSAGFR